MTRFHSSCPELAVHSNLLLKRKLPKECEQYALRDATAYVSVRVGYGRHVGAHLLIVCSHVNVRRRDGGDQTEQPERGELHRKREEPEARAGKTDAPQKFSDARPVAVVFRVAQIQFLGARGRNLPEAAPRAFRWNDCYKRVR